MILKSLRLENIRSYIDQTIEFPLGTTLFEGDIGTGKSTILLAIEFALFGLGSERGGALLRLGSNRGSVTLKFEVDGEEYEIYRSLERRGKGIQQSEGYIRSKDGVLRLSASEMKERVLEILKFNEPPDPKAQSVIYRYAVFTPQEEMKAILWMNPDSRLQTLRKAFRIEDYRIVVENASLLSKLIRDKSLELSSRASDLEKKEETCKKKEAEITFCEHELASLLKIESDIESKLVDFKCRHAELQRRKEELGKVIGEIPFITNQIQEKEREIESLKEEVKRLTEEIDRKLQPTIDELNKVERPTTKSKEELGEEMERLKVRERELRRLEATIEAKIKDYESVVISGICPTCDRPAEPEEFKEKVKSKEEEIKGLSKEIKNCEKMVEEMERLLSSLEEYRRMQEKLQGLKEQARERTDRVEKANERISMLTKQVEETKCRLEKAHEEIESFNLISEEAENLEREIEKKRSDLRKIESDISKRRTTMEILKEEVSELMEEVERKRKERGLAERLKEYQMWLEEFFMSTVNTIEKHAMLNINQEFDQQFRKWWSLLVEDLNKECRVDEDFTPVVEQEGYEQDIYHLSGGEKTSLALAYRLALNSVVQRVSAGIRSNILILDEPTDGFSREQVFKIREILHEMRCPQVIIVSHERELEGFADQVFRVEKREGVSEVKST
ncbi:MAG: AAA family ATPase [Candidatus Bathyarchaeia archaeon]